MCKLETKETVLNTHRHQEKTFKMLNCCNDASEKQNAKKNENEQVRKNKKSVTLVGIYSLSLQSLGLQTT